MLRRAIRRRTLLRGAAASLAAPAVLAQAGWPARPVRVVVPFPPGSAADSVPRALAPRLQAALDVPCVIDNKPGAGGMIGAEAVAKAAPDGYTLLSHASSFVSQPHVTPTPYDVLRDFVPLSQTLSGSYALVVPPSFPADDLAGWVEVVRRRPGQYSYGSYGSGSGPHLAMELLKGQAGLYIVHVPFRGAAAGMRELLAGRIDMAFDTTFAAVPHVRSGKLKAIAVGGLEEVASLPGVQRVAELYPGFDTDGWQGFFAPAGTPEAVARRLADEIAQAVREPEFAAQLTDLGFRAIGSTPEAFALRVRTDFERWGRVVRERGITGD